MLFHYTLANKSETLTQNIMKKRAERGWKPKNKGCKQPEVNYFIFNP